MLDKALSTGGGQSRTQGINRVLWTVLICNLVIAAGKFVFGQITHTASIRADGIHSLFDSTGNVVALIGIAMASRPADLGHPYGHSKFETYASVFIGALLVFAAWEVGSDAIEALRFGNAKPEVSIFSFVVMIVTLITNIFLTRLERGAAKRYNSEILAADSKHTLSDAVVTMSVLVGLVLVYRGYPMADAAVSLIVAAAILMTAFSVLRQANSALSDSARIPASELRRTVLEVEDVHDCHAIRTRGTESEVYVDLHVLVDPLLTMSEAHVLADRVEEHICEQHAAVVDVVVHLEPDDAHQQETSERELMRDLEDLKTTRFRR